MKKKLKDLGLDLLVVFIGVFAAFQLSDIKDSKKDKVTKLNYFESFKRELVSVNQDVISLRDSIDQIIDFYETGISNGTNRQLMVFRHLNFMAKPHIVESAFDSEIFTNMNPGYLVSISRGANIFYQIDYKMKEYNERCKDLLYNKDENLEKFYNENGLKPQYQWYLEDLKEIRLLLNALNVSIEKGAVPGTEFEIERMK